MNVINPKIICVFETDYFSIKIKVNGIIIASVQNWSLMILNIIIIIIIECIFNIFLIKLCLKNISHILDNVWNNINFVNTICFSF